MNLNQLYYLVEIVKYGSISMASKQLNVTQQNVSIAIRNMESELGTKILNRTSRGVFLTKEGEEIYQSALKIVHEIHRIQMIKSSEEHAADDPECLRGNIQISVSPYFTGANFMSIINRFLLEYPAINFDFYEKSCASIIDQVEMNPDQLGLINIEEQQLSILKQTHSAINFRILNSDQLMIVVNLDSDIGKQKSVSMKRLYQYKLIFYNESSTEDDWMLHYFQSNGNPKSIIRCNSVGMAISILKNNVALLPVVKEAASKFTKDNALTVIPIRPRIDIYNVLLTNVEKQINKAEKIFLNRLSEILH